MVIYVMRRCLKQMLMAILKQTYFALINIQAGWRLDLFLCVSCTSAVLLRLQCVRPKYQESPEIPGSGMTGEMWSIDFQCCKCTLVSNPMVKKQNREQHTHLRSQQLAMAGLGIFGNIWHCKVRQLLHLGEVAEADVSTTVSLAADLLPRLRQFREFAVILAYVELVCFCFDQSGLNKVSLIQLIIYQ